MHRLVRSMMSLFFFNDTATTEIYTLSLHDALPICSPQGGEGKRAHPRCDCAGCDRDHPPSRGRRGRRDARKRERQHGEKRDERHRRDHAYTAWREPRGVAQVVEHRSPKPGVAGSSPVAPAGFVSWRLCLLTALVFLAVPAAANATCPPPRHPPPVNQITRPRWLPGVLITEYYPAPERWFSDRLVRAPGLPGRHRAGWLYSSRGLAMQGEGIGSDGRMYHFAGPYTLTWRNVKGRDTLPCAKTPGAWTNGRP